MVYPKPTDNNTLSSDPAAAGMAYRMVIIDRDRLRAWLVAQSSADCKVLLERLDKGEFDGQVAIKQPARALRDAIRRQLFESLKPPELLMPVQYGKYLDEIADIAAQVAQGMVAQGGIDREKLLTWIKDGASEDTFISVNDLVAAIERNEFNLA